MLTMSLSEFLTFRSHFNNPRWEVVTKFMFGPSNRSVRNRTKDALSVSKSEVIDWGGKVDALKSFALELIDSIGI